MSSLSQSPPTTDIQQCGFLDLVLPDKVSLPGQIQYLYQESRYWSQQQETTNATCRVAPTQSIDVACTLHVLKLVGCQFAVKSGGHGAFVGASNINGGVTIDLLNMNEISISADGKQTSYGTGNRWIDVYKKIEGQGLAVVGGRVADIGVGGLTLGGGISFFSGRYGFACDNVNNYEVYCNFPVESTILTGARLCSRMDPSIRSTRKLIQTSTSLFAAGATTLALLRV
jgi:hypothetical protein